MGKGSKNLKHLKLRSDVSNEYQLIKQIFIQILRKMNS